MSLKDEIKTYDDADISNNSGEIKLFNQEIFENTVRKRQLNLINLLLKQNNHRKILDLGSGGGWLSRILESQGYDVTGIDISPELVSSAKKNSNKMDFVIGNSMDLPFKDESFDLVISVGVLHHLDVDDTLAECKRVLTNNDAAILMSEPNKYNPISFLGKAFFPTDIHTEEERHLSLKEVKCSLKKYNFSSEVEQYQFLYSFGLAYLISMFGLDKVFSGLPPVVKDGFYYILNGSEILIERIPIMKRLSWSFFIYCTK